MSDSLHLVQHERYAPIVVCLPCAARMDANFQLPSVFGRSLDFELNSVQGSLGQLVASTLFRAFRYEVSLFGYENRLGSMVGPVARLGEAAALKVRSMPDLFVYSGILKQGSLIEVKTQTGSGLMLKEAEYRWYTRMWREAVLVLVQVPAIELYAVPVATLPKLEHTTLTIGDKPARKYDVSTLGSFASCFRMDGEAYGKVLDSVRQRLRAAACPPRLP